MKDYSDPPMISLLKVKPKSGFQRNFVKSLNDNRTLVWLLLSVKTHGALL